MSSKNVYVVVFLVISEFSETNNSFYFFDVVSNRFTTGMHQRKRDSLVIAVHKCLAYVAEVVSYKKRPDGSLRSEQ